VAAEIPEKDVRGRARRTGNISLGGDTSQKQRENKKLKLTQKQSKGRGGRSAGSGERVAGYTAVRCGGRKKAHERCIWYGRGQGGKGPGRHPQWAMGLGFLFRKTEKLQNARGVSGRTEKTPPGIKNNHRSPSVLTARPPTSHEKGYKPAVRMGTGGKRALRNLYSPLGGGRSRTGNRLGGRGTTGFKKPRGLTCLLKGKKGRLGGNTWGCKKRK